MADPIKNFSDNLAKKSEDAFSQFNNKITPTIDEATKAQNDMLKRLQEIKQSFNSLTESFASLLASGVAKTLDQSAQVALQTLQAPKAQTPTAPEASEGVKFGGRK